MNPDLEQILAIPNDQLDTLLESMGVNLSSQQLKINAVISPKALQKYMELWKPSSRMVHYTKASNLLNIAKGNSIWLRNVELMSDKTEITSGYAPLLEFVNSESSVRLWNLLDSNCNGVSEQLKDYICGHEKSLFEHTYIFCLCEYSPEVPSGTVDMWERYAEINKGKDGVSVVIDPVSMREVSDVVGANSYPVIYADKRQVFELLDHTVQRIVRHGSLFTQLSENEIIASIWSLVEQFAYGIKDPFFKTENEWRIVYNPIIRGENLKITPINKKVNSNKPENYALQLQNYPEEGLTGLTIKDLVKRVLIPNDTKSTSIRSDLLEANRDFKLGLDDAVFEIVDLPVEY